MSGETTEENILPFSYDVARPMSRHSQCPQHHPGENNGQWEIYEKGSEKSRTGYEITYEKIRSALLDIRLHIVKTKLQENPFFSSIGFHIHTKSEQRQNFNSIMTRGVIYSLQQLSKEQRRKGVIAISTGTFACILCHYGKELDIPVTVVLPTTAADKNVRMCRDLLATVILHGTNMIQAHDKAVNIAMKKGLFYLDRNDHPNMIIGQATLGIEIFEQEIFKHKEGDKELLIDAVILPTPFDGCGLTMAIALAIKGWKPDIPVFEVLPEDPDPLVQDVQDVRTKTVSLDELSITVKKYSGHVDSTCLVKKCFKDVIKINETEIQVATNILRRGESIYRNKVIGLAAILSGKLDTLKGKSVVLPLFGKMDSSMELTANRQ